MPVACLIETSILGHLANANDALYPVADHAVMALRQQGEELHTAPQNFVEFRSVATRPIVLNGLGLLPAIVEAKTAIFEASFSLLPETPEIYPAWKSLVQEAGVVGKQVHDARLVAICHVYDITHVLTFNVRHFARFVGYGPGLIVVDPSSV